MMKRVSEWDRFSHFPLVSPRYRDETVAPSVPYDLSWKNHVVTFEAASLIQPAGRRASTGLRASGASPLYAFCERLLVVVPSSLV
jgi:hypothetical protein